MSQKKYQPASPEQLAREASDWDRRVLDPRDWADAPEAAPRADASIAISLRLPKPMLAILKEFARREGVGYEVLRKRWLEDRIRAERDRLAAEAPSRSS